MATRTMVAVALLATGGCMLSQFRQRAVEYSLTQAANARDEIVVAAKATRKIAGEIETAVTEDRPPQVAQPVRELAAALSAAHGHAEEAGKTLAVMQEDLGRPQEPAPMTPEAADAMRAQYRSASRMWKMAMSWAKSKLPLLGRGRSTASQAPGGGWTPTGIAGLISAIVATGAAAGEGTRRTVKSARRRLAEKNAETDDARAEAKDAMAALDEIKKTHPDAVKKATNSKKHPDLRRAYVRREAAVGSGTA